MQSCVDDFCAVLDRVKAMQDRDTDLVLTQLPLV